MSSKQKIKAAWKDILIRAGKTALQAFLAAIPITAATLEGGSAAWRSALIGATAAGLSAAMNIMITALGTDLPWEADDDEGGNENV